MISTKSTTMFMLVAMATVLMAASASGDWGRVYRTSWSSRSGYCAKTGMLCKDQNPCCSHHDVCLTFYEVSPDMTKAKVSRCMNMGAGRHNIVSLLPAGSRCTTSYECEDRCCREYRGHRYGKLQVCGTPVDEVVTHTCVGQDIRV